MSDSQTRQLKDPWVLRLYGADGLMYEWILGSDTGIDVGAPLIGPNTRIVRVTLQPASHTTQP